MTIIKRNIFANVAGGSLIAVLTIAITPLQIHLLGMEAFGIIGFVATLQVVLGIFDLGLSATITRELAGDQTPGRQASQKLIQTTRSLYWFLALVFGLTLVFLLGNFSGRWLNPQELDITSVTIGMGVAALYLALRWPVAFYIGVLSGIQRMDVLNVIKVSAVALRLIGGIGILLLWPTLESFLGWLAVSALIEVAVYAYVCQRYFPEMPKGFAISIGELSRIWRYTLSMNAIAILSLLLTQTDRLLVSRMLSLETLGHYMLAYTAASGILIIQLGISSAMFPAFADAHGRGGFSALSKRYERATQITLYSVGLVAFPLVFFGEPVLSIWVGSQAAASSWFLLALLAAGFWFSAASSNAYNAAVASRFPGLPLKVNLFVIAPYLLVLYVAIQWGGAMGAGAVWLGLNLLYLVTLVPLVHRKILVIPYTKWMGKFLLRFLVLGVSVFGAFRFIALLLVSGEGSLALVSHLALLCIAALCYGAAGYALLDADLRIELRKGFRGAMSIFRRESI